MSSIAIDSRIYRLSSIDFLRGLVIVIMAIDHVRDFFMAGGVLDPMSRPDVPLAMYITRWFTHFCAPVFVFLAGTSVGLMSNRKSKKELGSFLLKRGIWLIVVELFIINGVVTFFDSDLFGITGPVLVLQVIWAIGASMLVLAAVQFLGGKVCLFLGLMILFGHNMLDSVWPVGSGQAPAWVGLYRQSVFGVGSVSFIFVYPLIPWIGIMLLGYGTAYVFNKPESVRKTYLINTGIAMTSAFLVLRLLDFYGEPNHWQKQEFGWLATVLDFMNLTKYPPSLLFTLATLGPMAILVAFAEQFRGWFKDTLVMFGRVPFFFYVAHFAIIHLMSIGFGVMQGFEARQFFTLFTKYPQGYGTGLVGVYLAWLIVLIILYPLCRWMANIKATRKDWWLSYL